MPIKIITLYCEYVITDHVLGWETNIDICLSSRMEEATFISTDEIFPFY